MRIQYHDKWLRIISYPLLGFVVRHFGEYESIGTLMKQPLYYGDLLWNTLLVAFSWESNRRLIIYLDQKYPWVNNQFQRFIIQAFGSLIITVPVVASMIYIWNELIINRPGNFNTGYLLVYDFPLTIVFTLVVHMIYTGMYFQQYYTLTIDGLHNRVRELETSVAGVSNFSDLKKPSGFRKLLIVNYGSASVPVETNDLAFIYKQNEICFLKTFEGKEYTSSSSLETLEEQLDPAVFFRLNRQIIGNIKAIKLFKSDSSGKLILTLDPPTPIGVVVSKKRAAEFKIWIGSKV
jgi:hypothetical protein